MTESQPVRRGVLLLSRDFAEGEGGGLAIAMRDVAEGLRLRGWTVDRPGQTASHRSSSPARESAGLLGEGLRWGPLTLLQSRLPRRLRRWLIELSRSSAYFARASAHLDECERWLRRGPYDLVLVCGQGLPPGVLDLATKLHPRVVAIGLSGLADEVRYRRLWQVVRLLARLRIGEPCHSSLTQVVNLTAVQHFVFASEGWRSDAVAAGVPVERTSTVYFGVPLFPVRPRRPWGDQVLWVGRMSPEKGLHRLLDAVPAVRAQLPELTVTAIAAPGAGGYARFVERKLRSPGARSCVTLLGARARAALSDAYRDHDVLVFYSVFAEPVALVVLEAFAAGLPVVASRPATREGPVRDNETCLCFDPDNPHSLADALTRVRGDEPLRRRLAAHAREVVAGEFSAERMGDGYASLLKQVTQTAL